MVSQTEGDDDVALPSNDTVISIPDDSVAASDAPTAPRIPQSSQYSSPLPHSMDQETSIEMTSFAPSDQTSSSDTPEDTDISDTDVTQPLHTTSAPNRSRRCVACPRSVLVISQLISGVFLGMFASFFALVGLQSTTFSLPLRIGIVIGMILRLFLRNLFFAGGGIPNPNENGSDPNSDIIPPIDPPRKHTRERRLHVPVDRYPRFGMRPPMY